MTTEQENRFLKLIVEACAEELERLEERCERLEEQINNLAADLLLDRAFDGPGEAA